jgi:hypothetical protein
MCEFLHAFKSYFYGNLCEKNLELRKNIDESLEDFVIRFSHLCYRFPLEDRPSSNDFISCLVYLASETYESMDEESKSCFNVPLHVDLDLNENIANTNPLVELHMFGYFFIMEDIHHIENYFLKEIYLSSHHSIPPFFPFVEKEASCVNSSSNFSVVDQEEGFPFDNGTHRVTLMVMLGYYFPISYFSSQGMEEKAMEQNLNADNFVNEENLDTREMNSSSPMENLKSIPVDIFFSTVTNSLDITDI